MLCRMRKESKKGRWCKARAERFKSAAAAAELE